MPIPDLDLRCRLYGASVFLSASIPTLERRDEYDRVFEAPTRIEEAIISIARAVFVEGGTLVFGGHPSISPLIAQVVEEYYLPAPADQMESSTHRPPEFEWRNPSVVIYQSDVWKKYWSEATRRLARHPLVSIKWTKSKRGEKVDPAIQNRPQAPQSMERMRRAMIKDTSPIVMIAIGGMEGVLDEAQIFADLHPDAPIYALETTGGAAALLRKRQGYANALRFPDYEVIRLVKEFWSNLKPSEGTERIVPEETAEDRQRGRDYFVPYGFVAQRIVEEVINPNRKRLE